MIIGLNSRPNVTNLMLVVNDEAISENLKIANTFNDHFVTMGGDLSKKITSTIDPLSYVTRYKIVCSCLNFLKMKRELLF